MKKWNVQHLSTDKYMALMDAGDGIRPDWVDDTSDAICFTERPTLEWLSAWLGIMDGLRIIEVNQTGPMRIYRGASMPRDPLGAGAPEPVDIIAEMIACVVNSHRSPIASQRLVTAAEMAHVARRIEHIAAAKATLAAHGIKP